MQANTPKYMVLLGWIREQIEGGSVQYGERFYSENKLGEMFSLSRQTVRQALGILEAEGWLERRRGSGTYVAWRPGHAAEKTMTVGVVSTYTDDYIFPSIIRGIEQVLSRQGYSMQLTFTHNRVENETRALQGMAGRRVDGIIAEPTKSGLPNPNLALYRRIQASDIPIVFFNACYPNTPFPHVALDDRAAGDAAAEYLIRAGHRRIAGLFQSDDLQGHLRYAGYLDALIRHGIPVQAERVLWFATEDVPALFSDAARLEGRLAHSTAALCYNDQIAQGLLAYLAATGRRVPQDVSVMGVDDSPLASYCEPPLTTIRHPKEALGRAVAENLLRLIKDPAFSATLEFEPKIVERASVAPPRYP